MLKILLFLLLMITMVACSRVQPLGLKSHEFGKRPHKIIWIQLAGFSEEHLALLRFNMHESTRLTPIEKMDCIGKAWNYNLFDLRPSPQSGFLSQLMGTKNIKNSCEDYKQRPVWQYLEKTGYSTGIFEAGSDSKTTLEKAWDCAKEGREFRDRVTLWRMNKAPKNKEARFFHYQDRGQLRESGIFYDKTCQETYCYASMPFNIKSIYERFQVNRKNLLFIVRDFSYYKALQNKKISKAIEVLTEIESIISYFLEKAEKDKNMLVVISSSAVRHFEFPKEGKQWAEFQKKGKHIIFRRNSLISSVLATGARAENFCGIYEESEILSRLLGTPKDDRSLPKKIFSIFN